MVSCPTARTILKNKANLKLENMGNVGEPL